MMAGTSKAVRIDVPTAALTDLCSRWGVHRLSFFGSVLRDDFSPASDIDVLVEFEPSHVPGLFGFSRLERELTALLRYPVDLHTPGSLSAELQERVLSQAQPLYDAA